MTQILKKELFSDIFPYSQLCNNRIAYNHREKFFQRGTDKC